MRRPRFRPRHGAARAYCPGGLTMMDRRSLCRGFAVAVPGGFPRFVLQSFQSRPVQDPVRAKRRLKSASCCQCPRGDWHRGAPRRTRAGQEPSRGYDARRGGTLLTGNPSRSLQLVELLPGPPHVPHPRDPVGHEEAEEVDALITSVDMHVPKAGDQELPGSVHHRCVLGDAHLAATTYRLDFLPGENHRAVLGRWHPRRIDDGGMREDERSFLGLPGSVAIWGGASEQAGHGQRRPQDEGIPQFLHGIRQLSGRAPSSETARTSRTRRPVEPARAASA